MVSLSCTCESANKPGVDVAAWLGPEGASSNGPFKPAAPDDVLSQRAPKVVPGNPGIASLNGVKVA